MKRFASFLIAIATVVIVVGSSATVAYSAGNEQQIYDFLTSTMGLNTAAACGVLANIEKESNFNPNLYGDGGTSYGICQWHNERFTALKNFCNSIGYDWQSLTGQLYYLQRELTTESRFAIVISTLRSVPNTAQGAYDAAYRWCYSFEVPRYYATPYQGYSSESEYRAVYAKNTYWPKYEHNAISGYLSKCKKYASYCTVNVTKDATTLYSLPCNSTTDSSSKKVETADKNSVYTAIMLIYNDQNHYWYRVISKSGEDAYLYAGNCSYIGRINDLSISNPVAPTVLEFGQPFPIGGIITTEYSELSVVAAYVYNGSATSGTAQTGDSIEVGGTLYSLQGSAIDAAVKFNTLSTGRYTYVVSAQSVCNYAMSISSKATTTNSKVLYSAQFNINSAAIVNHAPVGKITNTMVGEEFVQIEGWAYDEDYILFPLTIYVVFDGVKLTSSFTANSLNEAVPIDNKYKGFSAFLYPLAAGEHDIVVYATNIDEYGNALGNDVLLYSERVTVLEKHVHHYDAVVIEPSCLQQGYTLHQCSCGEKYKDTYVNAIGHNYTGYQITQMPTQASTGTIAWFCAMCSYVEQEQLPTLQEEGSYRIQTVQEATCTDTGYARFYLTDVISAQLTNSVFFESTLDTIAHSFTDTIVPSTCSEQGYTNHSCTLCGFSEKMNYTAALGHNYENGVCLSCGATDPSIIMGDINGDGDITAADAVLLARYLTELTELTTTQLIAADINNDGDVTSADAVLLLRFLTGFIDSFDGIKP